MFILASDFDTV